MITKTKRIDLTASQEDEKNLRIASKKLGSTKVSQVIFDSVAKVANESVTFWADRAALKQIDSNVTLGLIHLQKFLDQFKELTGQNLTRDELENTFLGVGKLGSAAILEESIRQLVTEKLYEQKKLKYSDLKVTYEMLPDTDLTGLFKIAENLDLLPGVKMQYVGIFWRVYSV